MLQQFLRLCVHEEPSPEDFHFFLGFNAVVPPHVREGLLARHVNNDAVIRRTRKPVSLVYGEADQIVSPRMCTHIEGLALQATVATYPNVGHMPFWEAPERFNRKLRDFRNRAQCTHCTAGDWTASPAARQTGGQAAPRPSPIP